MRRRSTGRRARTRRRPDRTARSTYGCAAAPSTGGWIHRSSPVSLLLRPISSDRPSRDQSQTCTGVSNVGDRLLRQHRAGAAQHDLAPLAGPRDPQAIRRPHAALVDIGRERQSHRRRLRSGADEHIERAQLPIDFGDDDAPAIRRDAQIPCVDRLAGRSRRLPVARHPAQLAQRRARRAVDQHVVGCGREELPERAASDIAGRPAWTGRSVRR